MESNRNNIDNIFKAKLERHPSAPSAEAWASIAGQLPSNKNSIRKKTIWYVAASVCLLFISSVLMWNNQDRFFAASEQNIQANIDLGKQNTIASPDMKGFEKPALKIQENKDETFAGSRSVINNNNNALASVILNKQTETPEKSNRTIELQVINKIPSRIDLEENRSLASLNKGILTVDPQLIVSNSYKGELQKNEHEIIKAKNKIKSLASELSIADLRSAKNELFASALQFEKKPNN